MMTEKQKQGLVWGVTVLGAAVFLAAAAGKLSGQQQMIENFRRWGLSEQMLYFVGGAELVGAVGLLIPATATLAATGLAVIMMGAIFVHLSHGEGPKALIPLVLLCLVMWVAKQRRGAITALLGSAGHEGAQH